MYLNNYQYVVNWSSEVRKGLLVLGVGVLSHPLEPIGSVTRLSPKTEGVLGVQYMPKLLYLVAGPASEASGTPEGIVAWGPLHW